jgi:hypothetical protein
MVDQVLRINAMCPRDGDASGLPTTAGDVSMDSMNCLGNCVSFIRPLCILIGV